jgi:protein-L-isoaspartate(D-aspartate) O-methyltransferase
MEEGYTRMRRRMVEEQIAARQITDWRVLEAMRRVPRHLFLPPELRARAYEDCAIGIGPLQSISQPYIVALMAQLLQLHGTERALDVGTGSGYGAAVLAELAREVYTIECVPELAAQARQRLSELGYRNIIALEGDGWQGYPAAAPYDRILVAAAAPKIPPALAAQLALGGRMVLPLGSPHAQMMTLLIKTPTGLLRTDEGECAFVPLVHTSS